ncbi:class I SAM-dependent methyltransferase [Acidisphaera rubrifaciens]|uniref:Class I SAM-dependent methyltransferase n=1 Tax=Acidisphaera rubrifaciens HS-AP3 TaxID=1231350 RepID=A0A0D6PAY5_9PROT|nr:class I SAM-dependent methyltransferase [Acidisphaera rubrifaciens]GAN78358.1 hypothetical protein Asru_0788_02 [Acidisphaera rubrifaciens HS-AP3]
MSSLRHDGIDYITFLEGLDQALGPQSYFEIGTNTGRSLAAFSCDALCVDPVMQVDGNPMRTRKQLFWMQMTSDEFFRRHTIRHFLPNGPDIAFLDGMHRFEYLLRDFINTERECHPRSIILLHDCLPTNTRMAERVPRLDETEHVATQGCWTGDVWRMLPILRRWRPEMRLVVLDCPPTGLVACMNLDPRSRVLDANYYAIVEAMTKVDLPEYGLDRLWTEAEVQSSFALVGPPYNLTALFSVF